MSGIGAGVLKADLWVVFGCVGFLSVAAAYVFLRFSDPDKPVERLPLNKAQGGHSKEESGVVTPSDPAHRSIGPFMPLLGPLKSLLVNALKRLAILTACVFLAGIGFFIYSGYVDGKTGEAKSEMEEMLPALEEEFMRTGGYPRFLKEFRYADSTEIRGERQFFYRKTKFVRIGFSYTRKSRSEFEFSIGESGGVSVLNSKEKRWRWYD